MTTEIETEPTYTADDPERPFEDNDPQGTESIELTDERKITWGYVRKRNLGNYENEEVALYVTDMVPENEGIPHFLNTRTEPMFDMIKQEVWAALDLGFSFNAAGQPVLDDPALVPPPAPVPYPNPRDPVQAGHGHPPAIPQGPPVHSERAAAQRRSDPPVMAQVGVHAPPPDFCKKCGGREFWDNRTDVDERIRKGMTCTPDWVCKNQQCKQGVFRPGSFEYNQAIKQKPGSTGPMPTQPPAQAYGPDEVPFG